MLVSVKFVSAVLGPEMAAPILWARGKIAFFCRKTHVHKIPRFRGVYFGFFGGGSADFIFMGARIFLIKPLESQESEPFQKDPFSCTPFFPTLICLPKSLSMHKRPRGGFFLRCAGAATFI